jgi:hypothetical protein
MTSHSAEQSGDRALPGSISELDFGTILGVSGLCDRMLAGKQISRVGNQTACKIWQQRRGHVDPRPNSIPLDTHSFPFDVDSIALFAFNCLQFPPSFYGGNRVAATFSIAALAANRSWEAVTVGGF